MPGAIIYEGPSLIDQAPIVAIATWGSTNAKTGDMVQTWILRADVPPIEANRTGADRSICGDCALRGVPTNRPNGTASNRQCYVSLVQAPTAVWRTYRAGRYDRADLLHDQVALGTWRFVRIGAYGDGAAVPERVWRALLTNALGHTAYSHTRPLAARDLYMASVETLTQAQAAWASGYRTFRVMRDARELQPNEIVCPNETRGIQCRDCMLCHGASSAKSIAISAHGNGKVHFFKETQ